MEKRPYIIIGCFVAGMFLTPQDPLSQAFVAIPMWMLFEIGVIAGRILHKEDDEEDDKDDKDEEKTEESDSSEQDSQEKDS